MRAAERRGGSCPTPPSRGASSAAPQRTTAITSRYSDTTRVVPSVASFRSVQSRSSSAQSPARPVSSNAAKARSVLSAYPVYESIGVNWSEKGPLPGRWQAFGVASAGQALGTPPPVYRVSSA